MTESHAPFPIEVPAFRVKQWLPGWDEVQWDPSHHQAMPEPHFFLFALSASMLKKLSKIQHRSATKAVPRSLDLGIQRFYDKDRAEEISQFVRYGYPWSDLSERQRRTERFGDLRKPGWLPTAIIVNILKPGDLRDSVPLESHDCISVIGQDNDNIVLRLPHEIGDPDWSPSVPPIEVIDGQHRLWAFGDTSDAADFQLPVVAFHGLDISWQAYLFWTINIKPKRINASLAFDLIPLLRTEEWLERFEGHAIYRETRAQELVESLWLHPESPWYQRINMLGEPSRFTGDRRPMVSQAAWIRALLSTYVRPWEGMSSPIGGLFGAPVGSQQTVLPWTRAQQAAFLIMIWREMKDAVEKNGGPWADALREAPRQLAIDESPEDLGFYGQHSLFTHDQGVRGLLSVTNDMCYIRSDEYNLPSWRASQESVEADPKTITAEINSLSNHEVVEFVRAMTSALAEYDWRASSFPGLAPEDQRYKSALRGSGGYRQFKLDLLQLLSGNSGEVGRAAQQVLQILR